MEEEPAMHLELSDGNAMEATRDNATLFRHYGHLAMYDHVFIVTDEEENMGAYVFSVAESFATIAEFMIDNAYPAHLNLREVAECDMNAFDKMVARESSDDLDGGVPESWITPTE